MAGGANVQRHRTGAGPGLLLLLAVPVALLAVLFALPHEREVTYGMERNATATPASLPLSTAAYSRDNIKIISHGDALDVWLYTPTASKTSNEADAGATDPAASSTLGHAKGPHPVVIMAHGLGAQKDFGLHRYADVFAGRGMAVVVFDYRTFGGSEGQPRHWVSPRRHLQDWRAVVQHVKDGGLGPSYDEQQVALWGTSFAGGHVLVTAAALPPGSIKAVVSLVPHLDGVEASKANLRRRGLLGTLRFLAAGLHDKLRSIAGLPGAYVKLAGTTEELAIMQLSSSELDSYFAKHPKEKLGGWQPRALARFVLEASGYSPIAHVPSLDAPVLFLSAMRDSLCPHHLVVRAAGLVPGGRGQLLQYDTSHFDIYHGDAFASASKAMADFFKKHFS